MPRSPVSFVLPLVALLLSAPAPALAGSSDVQERLQTIERAWEGTRNYCGTFLLAIYGKKNAGMSTGTTCWDRSGWIRTETDSPFGPVIEIRGDKEVWYHDPARPVVIHLKASADMDIETRQVGKGLGEVVDMLLQARDVQSMPDTELGGRDAWAFTFERGSQGVVVFVDAEHKLPVALELRNAQDKPALSYGLVEFRHNPDLPPESFTIESPEGYPVVDLTFDPNQEAPADAAKRSGAGSP